MSGKRIITEHPTCGCCRYYRAESTGSCGECTHPAPDRRGTRHSRYYSCREWETKEEGQP